MHKNTKLTPTLRRDIYNLWVKRIHSLRKLGKTYHVDKNIIKTVIVRGRLGDFSVHDSTNHRFRSIEYGLKRLSVTERVLAVKIARLEKRNRRYERNAPGELVHGDTKRLPTINEKGKFRKLLIKSEVLYVWIDDYSRWLMADILPDRTMWSSLIFLDIMATRSPFPIQCLYSDNGGEFRGNSTHAYVAGCTRLGIQQRFTKPAHPWTNGKAERVIKTILEEWYWPNRGAFRNSEEQRQSLYRYIDFYNHERKHQGINNLTPALRLSGFYKNGDNA